MKMLPIKCPAPHFHNGNSDTHTDGGCYMVEDLALWGIPLLLTLSPKQILPLSRWFQTSSSWPDSLTTWLSLRTDQFPSAPFVCREEDSRTPLFQSLDGHAPYTHTHTHAGPQAHPPCAWLWSCLWKRDTMFSERWASDLRFSSYAH